jgi:hypothetical protein
MFLAMALLFVAGTTFHVEESEAARRQTVKRSTKKNSNKKRSRGVSRAVKNASTPAGVFALYQNASFGYAKCLPKPDESSKEILSRNGIKTANAAEDERAALAKGIAQVERLLGKPIPAEYQYDYQWVEAGGAWNSGISRPGYVTVKRYRGSPKGTLTGRMMHELGHRFGHANAGENYNDYRAHMRGKKCMITTYCGKSLNEEFAEVFEAYVVNPDFLAKHCPDSYAFFKNKLFRNSEAILASCEDPNSILEKVDDDDDDAAEDSHEQQIDKDDDFDLDLPHEGPMPYASPIREQAPVTPESTGDVAPPQEQQTQQQPQAEGVTQVAPQASVAVQPQVDANSSATTVSAPPATAAPTAGTGAATVQVQESAPTWKIPVPTKRPKK